MTKKTLHHRAHSKVAKKDQPKTAIKLEAKEFHHYEKNSFWYLGIGLLLVAIFIPSLRQGDYLFSLVIIALGIAIFRLSLLKPGHKKVEISSRGLYWGDQFYAYHQLKAFWLAETNGQANLYLERLNFAPTIHLIVPESKAEEIVGFLLDYLPFHNHRQEPLSDRLSRLLRI